MIFPSKSHKIKFALLSLSKNISVELVIINYLPLPLLLPISFHLRQFTSNLVHVYREKGEQLKENEANAEHRPYGGGTSRTGSQSASL
jgi:hypothetical protein